MTLNELGKAAHDNAKAHGFYDPVPSIPERLCLIHSEISEALEAYRDGEILMYFDSSGKPEGLVAELADALIRIVDLAACLNVDLDEVVEKKMKYNESRPFKHGRKVL